MEDITNYLREQAPDYEQGVNLLRKYHKNRTLGNLLQRKESVGNWAKLRYELAKLAGDLSLATLNLPLRQEQPTAPTPEPGSLADLHAALKQAQLELRALTPGTNEYGYKTVQIQLIASRIDEATQQVQADADPSLAELLARLTPEAAQEVDAITQLQARIFREKAVLSNSLGDATSRADRYHVVEEIKAKEQQYNALGEKKALIIERGTLPEPEATQEPVTEQERPAAAPKTEEPSLAVRSAELVKQRNNLRSNLSKARKSAEKAKTEAKRSEYEQKAGKLSAELEEVELHLTALAQ